MDPRPQVAPRETEHRDMTTESVYTSIRAQAAGIRRGRVQIALEGNLKLVDYYGVVGAPRYFLVGPEGKIVSTSGLGTTSAALAKVLGDRSRKRAVEPGRIKVKKGEP